MLKQCQASLVQLDGKTTDINFTYIDDNSYLTRIQMSAPVTFKNITLQVWQIAANGHALTFDEGVTVASGYTIVMRKIPASETFGVVQITIAMLKTQTSLLKAVSSDGLQEEVQHQIMILLIPETSPVHQP